MTALSGGHLAVDFASGSVPALIPFLTDRFDLNYAFAAMLLLASTVSSSLVQPLFGLWSDRRGALWLISGGTILSAVGVGLAAVTPWYPLVLVLDLRGRVGRGSLPSRGREVRGLRERPEASERHVVLQHRRQHRLRARRVRHRPACRGDRARRRPPRNGSGCRGRRAPPAVHPGVRGTRARSVRRRGDARGGRPPRDGVARCGDRAPCDRVVHAACLRSALGRVARALEGVRQPAALPDAARRRCRNARARACRGSHRPASDTRGDAGVDPSAHDRRSSISAVSPARSR